MDTELTRIPQFLLKQSDPLFSFNKIIIDATAGLVCAYKAQYAFYAACGITGIKTLIRTIEYVHEKYPEIPVILDAKRGDISSTAEKYAKEAFELFKADSVTVNPYLGFDSIEPFLKWREKGIIILCRTSNPGAADFQDLKVGKDPLYQVVAKKVVTWHKKYGNCLMVVGATWPAELVQIRRLAPDITFLVPGIGAQGGDLEKTIQAGRNKKGDGMIIHSSRGIIYVSNGKDFAQKARQEAEDLKNEINKYR